MLTENDNLYVTLIFTFINCITTVIDFYKKTKSKTGNDSSNYINLLVEYGEYINCSQTLGKTKIARMWSSLRKWALDVIFIAQRICTKREWIQKVAARVLDEVSHVRGHLLILFVCSLIECETAG